MNSKKIVTLMLEQGLVSTLLNKRLDGGLSVHGISTTEFVIMHKLATSASGNMSRIALADAVGLTASGVTRLLAPMEKNNITEKLANPRDARQSLVALSDVGRNLYNDANVTFVHSCTSAFSLLDESEIDMLLHLLNKIKC